MPTYDYRCKECQHEFEEFQSMSAKPLRKCPECGKLKLERLIGTGAGVIFKGSGFYETDYRSDSYKKAAKADSEGGKSEAKSDSKTEGKSEKKSDSSKKSETKPKTDKAKSSSK